MLPDPLSLACLGKSDIHVIPLIKILATGLIQEQAVHPTVRYNSTGSQCRRQGGQTVLNVSNKILFIIHISV